MRGVREVRLLHKAKIEEPSGIGSIVGTGALYAIIATGLAPLVLLFDFCREVHWLDMWDEFQKQFAPEIRICKRAAKELRKEVLGRKVI